MTIRTYSERTPWGIEWYAIDDDTYDGADKHPIAGVGPTEGAAIYDLLLGLEDVLPSCQALTDLLMAWCAESPPGEDRAVEVARAMVTELFHEHL